MPQKMKWAAVIGLAVLLVGVAAGLSTWTKGSAAGQTSVAYVDVPKLMDLYVVPELKEPLAAETEKLQKELNDKMGKTAEADRQKVFNDYQARLDARKQEMVEQILPRVNDAVAKVAKEQGFDLVLERQAVLYGGKDLTDTVLLKLGVKTGK